MGRASQWLKNLFGIKQKKEKKNISNASAAICNNPVTIPPNITVAESEWLRAAEAAAVKLNMYVNSVYMSSAIKIQTVFRGYLARRALKGLKALVKLQALMRGILVRKQAQATLHGMEALVRVQTIMRDKRNQGRYQNINHSRRNFHTRNIKTKCDDPRSDYITTIHSKRISPTFDNKVNSTEIGWGRPKLRSRTSNSILGFGDEVFFPIHSNNRSRLSEPNNRNGYDPDWALTSDEYRSSTAQSTPRFITGPNRFGNRRNGPLTPTNSVCGSNGVFHNYMMDTHSFRAKLRCQSAPRQRPCVEPKRRPSLVELMESRNSHSGVRMQRSCSQAQDVIAFKNAVLYKLDRSCDSGRVGERVSFSRRMS